MQAIASIDLHCGGIVLYTLGSTEGHTCRETAAFCCSTKDTSSLSVDSLRFSSSAALGGHQQWGLSKSHTREASEYIKKRHRGRGRRRSISIAVEAQASSEGKSAPPVTRVFFKLYKTCHFGQAFYVVGNQKELGSWNPEAALPLKWTEGNIWVGEVDVRTGDDIEFKYVLRGKRGEVEWQPGRNRIVSADSAKMIIRKPWADEEIPPEQPVVEKLNEAVLDTITTDIEEVSDSVGDSSDADSALIETRARAVDEGVNAVQLIDEALAMVNEILETEKQPKTKRRSDFEEDCREEDVVEAVAQAVKGLVREAVDEATTDAVDKALREAIHQAGPTAAAEPVPEAVDKAVPEAVDILLPQAGNEIDGVSSSRGLDHSLINDTVDEVPQDDQVDQDDQGVQLEAVSRIDESEELAKPLVQTEDKQAPVAETQNGATMASSESSKESAERESNKGILEDWGRSIWTNLLGSWGRKPLMDEESQKSTRHRD